VNGFLVVMSHDMNQYAFDLLVIQKMVEWRRVGYRSITVETPGNILWLKQYRNGTTGHDKLS
jgi:hypothetical protein